MPSTPPTTDGSAIAAGLASLMAAATPPLQHFTLANGLSVYLREDHRAPLTSVQLWYHVGSSHEPAGHSSLSHVLEHLMFKGSHKVPADAYSKVIARLGGKASATTYHDATAFEVELPANRLPVALEAMADAMANAKLESSGFSQEVKAVKDERRLKVDGEALANDEHNRLAHDGSPYGEPIFGHTDDLEHLRHHTVRVWYDTWYIPNNATLVVVGAIDLAQLRQHVQEHFGSIARIALREAPPASFTGQLRERSQTVIRPDIRDGLLMSFNTPSKATDSATQTPYALSLLCEVLGNGASSRLYGPLVRQRRLLKGLAISYDPLVRGDTLLTIWATTNPQLGTTREAAQAIMEIVEDLRITPLTESELESAKLRLLARLLYARDSHAWQCKRIGQSAAAGIDPALLDQEILHIQHLTSDTIQRVAMSYLHRDRLTTTYMEKGASA